MARARVIHKGFPLQPEFRIRFKFFRSSCLPLLTGSAKTETPAAAPAAPAPAPAAEKPKEAKAMKFWGTVAAYEAGKMITVKGKKDKEMAFDVTGDTKMKGEVKEGAKVTVMYKKDGDKMTATSIFVTPPKKKAAPKEEKKM